MAQAVTGRILLRWIVLCALGELFGMLCGAAWFGFSDAFFQSQHGRHTAWLAWLAMTGSAIPEATILVGAQVAGLRAIIPEIRARRWFFATAAVGLLGWGLGAAMANLAPNPPTDRSPASDALATAIFAAAFGALVGLVFGAAQAVALPRRRRLGLAWTIANGIGWMIGLPAIYLAASWGADLSSIASRLLAWAVGGLGAGFAVGLTTAVALWWRTLERSAPIHDPVAGD